MDEFVRRLVERLDREGFPSDTAEAQWLGVSAGLWSRVQRGEVQRSKNLIAGALQRYPDLAPYVPGGMILRQRHLHQIRSRQITRPYYRPDGIAV